MLKYYGKFEPGRYNYDEIKQGYKWSNTDDAKSIYCGSTSDKKIIVYWVD